MPRLDKLLCNLGLTTRSTCKKFVHKFDVKVNGVKPLSLAKHVTDEEVTVQGKPLDFAKPLHILLHKPVGYVTSRRQELLGDSKIVFELFPESFLRRRPPLVPVGRLDKWASGALIFTQNGDLVHTLSSPKLKTGSYGKVYEVKLQKRLTGNEAKLFSSGDVKLKSDTKPCKPALFEVINAEEKLVRITLYEGRYHQVRRMLGSLGNKVEQIKRIATGPIQLGDLPVGHWRLLTQAELDILNVVDLPKKSKKAEKYSRKNKQQKELLQNEKAQMTALNKAKKKAGATAEDFGNDDYDEQQDFNDSQYDYDYDDEDDGHSIPSKKGRNNNDEMNQFLYEKNMGSRKQDEYDDYDFDYDTLENDFQEISSKRPQQQKQQQQQYSSNLSTKQTPFSNSPQKQSPPTSTKKPSPSKKTATAPKTVKSDLKKVAKKLNTKASVSKNKQTLTE